MKSRKGFTVIEASILIVVSILIVLLAVAVYGQISSKAKIANDAVKSESLTKAKKELGARVSADRTIPDSVATDDGVSYARKDNQKAELCATFQLPRGGASDTGADIADVLMSYFSLTDTVHQIYRDNVDFAQHSAGRNCYVIDYAPINVAYEEKYHNDQRDGSVCDIYREYDGGRFTGQTIKGFFIGGSFTTNPGTAGGHAVLALDADAFDSTCKKIPLSALKVGDRVEMYIELGPKSGDDQTYFVKAIKKEF